ncbi:MAG: C39 family peptidase [Gammaproteobacteria bacterium]|nr:C39 family peptidase [Gammaproteobacteria bacterium]MCP5424784.1 C39 family peptidase [Gammaproteobacteria bacterium]MCP5458239.1 C39 family peptidase [Gammaproteobacteria bacterium]
MAKIIHKVPLVAQQHLNDCWIASFRMIERWYNNLLPTRPTLTTKNLESLVGGPNMLNTGHLPAFIKKTGMSDFRRNPTAAELEKLLKAYGPLWCPAKVGAHSAPTQGHVVVIIGIDGGDLFFNDPLPVKSGLAMQQFPIADFFGMYLLPVSSPSPFLVMLKNSRPSP